MSADPGFVLLFFSGVIAFVSTFPEPNVVNAYMITIDKHAQRLRVPLDSLEGRKCPYTSHLNSYCAEDETQYFCDCNLSNSVTVSISNEKKSTGILPDRPPGKLPTEQNVGDIGWLVNMWSVKPSAASFEKENVPDYVGGQISFNWTAAATCRFEEAPCKVNGKDKRRIYAVKFDVAVVSPKQAVPELVVFKSTNASKEVTITLEQREKQQLKPLATLKLKCPKEDSCPIQITNVMDLEDDSWKLCKECSEDKKDGVHFREYRKLTNDHFGVVPNRLCKSKHYTDLPEETQPDLCKPLGNLPPSGVPPAISNRVICPSSILVP